MGGIRKPGQPPNPEVPGYTPSGLVRKDKKVAYEMTDNDVEDLIQNYVSDIETIKMLGFDGVELHGAHGYMIDQFFWRDTNVRKDEYGKEEDLRTKFVCEIVSRSRKLVGNDFPIMLRFSQWKQQDYEARLAPSPTDLETFLGPISDSGVDVFHASTRRYWEPEFEGSDLNLAGWTKKITNKPTITVGSVGLDSDFIGLYVGNDKANTSSIKTLVEKPPDFFTKSSAPNFKPSNSSTSSSLDVRKIIGIDIFFLSFFNNSSPSIIGILISSIAKSGGFLLSPIKAVSPSI